MKKQLPAIIAAVVVTCLIGFAMLAVGVNALLNPNGVAAAAAPGATTQPGDTSPIALTGDPSAQVQQLQARIQEYQAREKQYQQQIDEARKQIQAAGSEVSQYKQVIEALQEMGVLGTDQNGNLFVPRFRRGGDD